MNEIVLSGSDKRGFEKLLDDCKKWSETHQAEIGVAEMAAGAGIIYWGLQSGLIQVGTDVVGSKLADIGGIGGVGIGAGLGTAVKAGAILKSIFVGGVSGVAGVTSVAAIPAIALIGGSAAILGAFGYAASDLAERFLEPSFGDYVVGASIVTIGLALMIDGARRIVKDERILKMASKFKDGVIQLAPQTTEIVVKTWDDLQNIVKELSKSPSGSVTAGTTAAAGAAIGGSLAAGSVTVLGSHGLGAAALSLGLVSAPVWPIIAGGAAGLAIGVAAWKGVKHYRNKQEKEPQLGGLLPSPDKE